jgi:hypothetical protein
MDLIIFASKVYVTVNLCSQEVALTFNSCKLPKRYTWQDLKDLVRKEAAHGIWTEMAFFSNGQTGETGWARVQRSEEASRLYSKSGMRQRDIAIRIL